MMLSIRGNGTVYHAGYRKSAEGKSQGIGLWTDDHNTKGLDDIAYLAPDEDGHDVLHISKEQLKKQGIRIVVDDIDSNLGVIFKDGIPYVISSV
jgi:hypothetical protein